MYNIFNFDQLKLDDPKNTIQLFNEIINEYLEVGIKVFILQQEFNLEDPYKNVNFFMTTTSNLNTEFYDFVSKLDMLENYPGYTSLLKQPRDPLEVANEMQLLINNCGKDLKVATDMLFSMTNDVLVKKLSHLSAIFPDPNYERFEDFTYKNYVTIYQYIVNNFSIHNSKSFKPQQGR
jgi:hypothetical protein